MPSKKGSRSRSPLNEPQPGIIDDDPPTPDPRGSIEPRKTPSKIKIKKVGSKEKRSVNEAEVDPEGEDELPKTPSKIKIQKRISKKSTVSPTKKKSPTQKWKFKKSLQTGNQEGETDSLKKEPSIRSLIKKKLGFRKIRVAPSKEKISRKSKKSGATIKSAGSKKTLDDLQVAPRLFNLGIGSADEENQKVWSLCPALPKKKTLVILGIIVLLLLLIALIVIIVIFATRKGSNNGTTPTSAPTTMSTAPTPIPGCNQTFPGILDPPRLGDYCLFCFPGDGQTCVVDCCAKYYTSSSDQRFYVCQAICFS